MLNLLLNPLVKRWLIGAVVSLVASAIGFVAWNAYKNKLRNEGRDVAIQICNEDIYRANEAALKEQLTLERERSTLLELRNLALRTENEAAITRRAEAENQVAQLLRDRETQATTDETYRDWSATPIPDGVVERLRRLQATDGAADQDSN